jgi:integrase
VFAHPETGQAIDRSVVRKRFKRALKKAKVRTVRFHDLRHSFGTRMASVGVPMRTLQEWLGHRDLTTTLIYADYAPSDHEAAWVEAAFDPARGINRGIKLSTSRNSADQDKPQPNGKAHLSTVT